MEAAEGKDEMDPDRYQWQPCGSERFSVVAARLNSSTVVICVRGELDMVTCPELRSCATAVLWKQPPTMVLDMRNVTFCSVAGLSTMLAAGVECEAVGTKLRVAPSRVVRRVVELTGLSDELGMLESSDVS
ncbi:STAS domain-containing protein [Amycolatopsis sp. H6(2020)]|nr:STAS domain-containing protein [Amycolatopsis sp. H6(2020)]